MDFIYIALCQTAPPTTTEHPHEAMWVKGLTQPFRYWTTHSTILATVAPVVLAVSFQHAPSPSTERPGIKQRSRSQPSQQISGTAVICLMLQLIEALKVQLSSNCQDILRRVRIAFHLLP